MAHLLDTNVCSAIIRARDDEFAHLALRRWPETMISSVTAHELEFWALHTGPQRMQRIRVFLNDQEIRPFDAAAASAAAKVRSILRAKPLSAYDALIAGHALALGAILVTADADFKRLPGLRTENWLKA
jgi:tRNA(fMet)-specific endonuclease VapC